MKVINLQIRPANEHDLPQLNLLMYQLHDFHHQARPKEFKPAIEIEKEKSISRYLDDPECLVFVACIDEKIIGFVTGHFCELVSMVSKPILMGSIDELFVCEEYRKQSVANKLMQRIELTFEQYGVVKVFVEVWAFNEKAMRFYHADGFEHHIHWMCKTIKKE